MKKQMKAKSKAVVVRLPKPCVTVCLPGVQLVNERLASAKSLRPFIDKVLEMMGYRMVSIVISSLQPPEAPLSFSRKDDRDEKADLVRASEETERMRTSADEDEPKRHDVKPVTGCCYWVRFGRCKESEIAMWSGVNWYTIGTDDYYSGDTPYTVTAGPISEP